MYFPPATIWRRLFAEDSGQDLIEYALLTGIVSVSTILVFASIRGKMENAYKSWETSGQTNWIPPPKSTP